MSPTIGWNESSPQGSDSLGLGDDEIRSLKTSVRIGLDGEHVWPSGGGDAGAHRLGSARPYVGTQSLVSSAGTDGRLMFTSDTSCLFGVGSGGTSFIGGPTVISAGSFPGGLPQRHYWATEFGIAIIPSGSVGTTISFPNSGYSGSPYVLITPFQNITSYLTMPFVDSVAATNFTARTQDGLVAKVGGNQFTWLSIGSRVL